MNNKTSEKYDQVLLERITDVKRRMETKRLQNHVLIPFAFVIMVFVYILYPQAVIIALLTVFMASSIAFNLVFILLPLYGKVYIAQKISLIIYKVIMALVVLIYIMNLVLVISNLTLADFTTINMGSLYLCHFMI